MTLLTWDLLALMGITLSFSIVTLIFMLSYLFNNEFLKSWSREEFFNVFITLLLFGSLLPLVKADLFVGNLSSAKNYVDAVFDNVLNIQIGIVSDISVISLISSLSFFLNLNALQSMGKGGTEDSNTASDDSNSDDGTGALDFISASITLHPLFSPFITSLTSLQVYSFVPITMIKLHVLLMDFIQKDASRTFPLLLAAGILLRAFKFTRNAGNTILALFISLFFVLPVIYLFNQGIVNIIMLEESLDEPPNSLDTAFVSKLMTIMMDEIKEISPSEEVGEDYGLTLGERLVKMVSAGGGIYNFLVRFFVEGFVLPYVSIIVALGIAREFAMTLGSNIDFSSLVRLV